MKKSHLIVYLTGLGLTLSSCNFNTRSYKPSTSAQSKTSPQMARSQKQPAKPANPAEPATPSIPVHAAPPSAASDPSSGSGKNSESGRSARSPSQDSSEQDLYFAARNGDIGKVASLLDHGADPNVTGGKNGDSALEAAAKHGHLDVAKLLASKRAKIDPADGRPTLPFQILSYYESLKNDPDTLKDHPILGAFASPNDESSNPNEELIASADLKIFDGLLALGSKLNYVGGKSSDGIHFHSLLEYAIIADLKLAQRGIFVGFTESLAQRGFRIDMLDGTQATDILAPTFEVVWAIKSVATLARDNPAKPILARSLVKSLSLAGLSFTKVFSGSSGLSEAMYNFDPRTFQDIYSSLGSEKLDFAALGPGSPFLSLASHGESDACLIAAHTEQSGKRDLQGRTGSECYSDILSNLEFYLEQQYRSLPEADAKAALSGMVNQIDTPLSKKRTPLSIEIGALTGKDFSPRLTELLVILGANVRQALEFQGYYEAKSANAIRVQLEKQLAPDVAAIIAGTPTGKPLWEEFDDYQRRWSTPSLP